MFMSLLCISVQITSIHSLESILLLKHMPTSMQAILQLSQEDCLLDVPFEVPLDIKCDKSDCSATVDIIGYVATIDKIEDDTIYITITDTGSLDENDGCTQAIVATVTCSDGENCVIFEYNYIDLVVTMTDGSIVQILDVEVQEI